MDHAPIHFHVRPVDPGAHLFELCCTVREPDPDGQIVAMAAWIPGSYMIRDFAKNVVWLRAEGPGGALGVQKLDKQTWRVAPSPGPIRLRYQVYCWDLSVRGAHLDQTHGYFNGTSLFLRVVGQAERPCTVELAPPDGEAYRQWRVATTLPSAGAPDRGFGLYRAADYDELVDHPVEMGTHTVLRFEARGVPHEMAISGRHRADTTRLARDLKTLCTFHIGLFGELPAMERYLFLVMAVGEGYGGLEHRSSTSLLCKRDDLPRIGQEEVEEGYRSFLGLCSHEYFHTWNIKQIRPAVFQPYDLSREVHTPLLWAFEGITSYYDDLALVRCGLISPESYLELLGQTLTRLLRSAGRFKQSVAESSFDAWTKFYKQDENAPNAIVSYYVKGAVIALALDLTIRFQSDGQRSLDDVMRALWQEYGKQRIGVDEAALEALLSRIAGVDLSGWLAEAIWGTADPPLADLLRSFGLEYQLRPADSPTDKGGKPSNRPPTRPRQTLGAITGDDPLGARITSTFEGGPAQQAGLAAGDIVVAVEGLRATHQNLERLLNHPPAGDPLCIHAFRRDELMTFTVVPRPAPPDTCFLTLVDDPDPQTRRRRDGWLGGDGS